MYIFTLHPAKWEFKKDSDTVFKVSKMDDGNYKVKTYLDQDTYIEDTLSAEEVLSNILNKYWVFETKITQ